MHIGIDIDDTISETTKLANSILHSDRKYENIADYHELSYKEFNSFCENHREELQKYAVLKDGVKEAIDYFKDKGCTITIITARGADGLGILIPYTERFLDINKIYYDKIIFAQKDKGKACKDNDITVFIDDKESVLDSIKNICPNTITLHFSPNSQTSKHQIVRSWFEIKDYIDNLLG